MSSAWRKALRPASLRGVPFEVESTSLKGGRRVVVNEYPQRSKHYNEDLGPKARTHSIVAFILGDDFEAKRDKLIAACEKGGPARLMHPLYGTISVDIGDYEVAEGSDAGRFARFTIDVTEAGSLDFPTGDVSSSSAVLDSADAADVAVTAAFAANFSVKGLPGFGLLAALKALNAALTAVRKAVVKAVNAVAGVVSDVGATIVELKADVAALVNLPASIAGVFAGLFATIGDNLDALAGLARGAGQADPVVTGTPTARRIAANEAAVRRLVVQLALTSSARAIARRTFASYDEAIAARDSVANALAAESEAVGGDVYDALSALRVAVVEDVELRAAQLVKLRTITVASVTSSLQLAEQLYGDGSRNAELEARNAWPHPGFIVGEIQVADV